MHPSFPTPASPRGWHAPILLVTAIVVLAATLEVVLLIFAGIVAGVFLARSSAKLGRWLRVPRVAALLVMLILGGAASFVLVLSLGPQVVDQIQSLLDRLPRFLEAAQKRIEAGWFAFGTLDAIEESVEQLADDATRSQLIEQGAGLLKRLAGIFSSTLGALTGIVIVLAIALYVGFEPGLYHRGIVLLVPPANRADATRLMDQLGRVLTWWFAGQALSMVVLGTSMAVGLWLLDIPFALVFGIFTALMTFIPNLGPIIAAVPVLLVALTQSLDQVLYVLILVVIVQNIEGLVLTPMVHRRFIALPPALILGALLVLGSLAGVIGVLVAMPLTAVGLTVTRFLIARRDGLGGPILETPSSLNGGSLQASSSPDTS